MALIQLLPLILFVSFFQQLTSGSELETYIVHVKKPETVVFIEDYHRTFLPLGIESSDIHQRFLYSYQNVLGGFAAKLTKPEVEAMKSINGFLSARPQRILRRKTTHTPAFLGLHQEMGVWKDSNFGKGIIIGVIDSGITPGHPSFSGFGMPMPPPKFKGKCELNGTACNNKLIGARAFNLASVPDVDEAHTPIDIDGHGTHTASTAAGSVVYNATVLGGASGTAIGIAPKAHLSIYKVCFGIPCPEADILAGIDAAIEDGVDVISISLGLDEPMPFFNDSTAIASFAAVQKGIFVSCAAGNLGPFNATLSNEAPWILTVGASTHDRKIKAVAKLGNNEEFAGESLFQPKGFSSTLMPLVYPGSSAAFCAEGDLNGTDVRGKVVICERGGGIGRVAKGEEVKRAGGVAMILINSETDGSTTAADVHVLPAVHLGFTEGEKILAYINHTSMPIATILFKGTVIGDSTAPAVSSFSSRGPSIQSPGILKPDIIGPGMNVLAAWPFSLDGKTNEKSTFNIISGTSMACPHLSGVAALLKSTHPNWSPAMIKSAIMTTANLKNLKGEPIVDQTLLPADSYATGAGHVNPSKANNPGLVYDISADDYIPYLCGLGYNDKQVEIIVHRPIKCEDESKIYEGELNYPTFAVTLGSSQTFPRTLTNVGSPNSWYSLVVVAPKGVDVIVSPKKLYFAKLNDKLTYYVTFKGNGVKAGDHSQGYLAWVSTKYTVRSVISVKFA